MAHCAAKNLNDIVGTYANYSHSSNPPILDVVLDSREVSEGSLFIAFPGDQADGRDFISAAVNQGAKAVLYELSGVTRQHLDTKHQYPDVPMIGVEKLSQKAGIIAANFFNNPSEEMTVVGITGTNGKTSCSYFLSEALYTLGESSALIGTLGAGVWGAIEHSKNTTPDCISLQRKLADFVDKNVKFLTMEVSSHGLDQGRVNGVAYHTAILTNITRDHLDYHGSMAHYTDVKKQLFLWPTLKNGILNIDDANSRMTFDQLADKSEINLFGVGKQLDLEKFQGIKIQEILITTNSIKVCFDSSWGEGQIENPFLYGEFNVYNLLLILVALLVVGFPLREAIKAIELVHGVPGRMDKLGGDLLPSVFIDYAHTPDALKNALLSARAYKPRKLLCVFGCGGNRDQGKRAEMGKVAQEYADEIIVTADNPRYESVERICQQITDGIAYHHYSTVIIDRAEAITHAIRDAQKEDIVLVAGKGAETYQEVEGQRLEYSDYEVVKSELTRRVM